MDSAFVENNGNTLVLSMDYSQLGFRNNESGSSVFISHDKGESWEDKLSGKIEPQKVAAGATDTLAAGFHINTVRLKDGRLLAMTRGQNGWDINGHITMSYSNDNGDTWTYRESPFPDIGGGQRLVLMRLNEGPLLLVSFEESRKFAAVSYDEGNSWPLRKTIGEGRRGYMAATQTPDNLIHLITSDRYFRFNLPWLEEGQ